jgi:small subunit ribosomal protein S8
MLTRIRNAEAAGHKMVSVPLSKIKLEIARILKQEGYIDNFKKSGKGSDKVIEINLKYPPVIREIKKISKSGRRVYVNVSKMRLIKSGHGISIISTSKGLMTNKEAHKARLGGEILVEIW